MGRIVAVPMLVFYNASGLSLTDSRRRIWIEAQARQFGSFAELNAWLGERCRALWSELRHPEYPDLSVADMLEQEQSLLMPMPTPFDGYVEQAARVSSTCLVTVQRNRYSVPCELAGQMVSTRLYPTRVCVVAGDVLVASHERIVDRKQVCYTSHWCGANPARCATAPRSPTCRHHCCVCGKACCVATAAIGSWHRFWLPCPTPACRRCWKRWSW
jgi:hypothetical protein